MQDGAFVLYLKMACTPLKVLDDCTRMCACSFSFFQKEGLFKIWRLKKEKLRRGKYPEQHHEVIQKCSALNSALSLR